MKPKTVAIVVTVTVVLLFIAYHIGATLLQASKMM